MIKKQDFGECITELIFTVNNFLFYEKDVIFLFK